MKNKNYVRVKQCKLYTKCDKHRNKQTDKSQEQDAMTTDTFHQRLRADIKVNQSCFVSYNIRSRGKL